MNHKIMNKSKKVEDLVKSQILPTVIYVWNIGGRKPHLSQPHWDIDIDSNHYSIYCEYMDQFSRSDHQGFTYSKAEEWLSETLIKLGLNK
jgi:hypothetical protein